MLSKQMGKSTAGCSYCQEIFSNTWRRAKELPGCLSVHCWVSSRSLPRAFRVYRGHSFLSIDYVTLQLRRDRSEVMENRQQYKCFPFAAIKMIPVHSNANDFSLGESISLRKSYSHWNTFLMFYQFTH